MGENFNLKIADFDHASSIKEGKAYGRGTENFRAPELKKTQTEKLDLSKSDVYSAGILLFNFLFGLMPYMEKVHFSGINLEKILHEDQAKFWATHQHFRSISEDVDEEIVRLINGMTKLSPEKRYSIEEIKKNSWFNGEIYTQEELSNMMKKLVSSVEKSKN